MCPASTAEVMMNAMIKVAQDKVDAGDKPGAIKTLNMIVDSIINNEAHVQKTFGQNLVYLYCWRAKLYFETDTPGDQATPDAAAASDGDTPVDDAGPIDHMELAGQDVRQAEAALETYFSGLDAAQKETVRASINAVIGPDEQQRAEGLAAVRQLETNVPMSGGTAVRSASGGQARGGEAGISLGVHAMVFVVGLIAWGIVIGLFYATFAATSSSSAVPWVLMIPAVILGYIAVDLATKGWDWLADRGVYGWRFKVMLIVFLLITVIGALPVVYWTGKGAVRWYYRRR